MSRAAEAHGALGSTMPSLPPVFRITLALAALAGLGMAAFQSAQIYVAEQLVESATEQNLRKAAALAPINSDAWARLGALLEKRGESDEAARALARAVALNHYDAAAWVDLGLHWEVSGDQKQAERCLLEAVRVDNTFYPRWVLANFYLREGDAQQFWTAMRAAISHSRADLKAVFELYWRAFDDPGEILEKGIPDTPEINRRYCSFLLQSGRTAAAAGVWKRLARRLEPADLPLGLAYANALLAGREPEGALHVWNELCSSRLIPYEPLDPAKGRVLTNGTFRIQPTGHLFDWKLTEAEGVSGDVETFSGRPVLAIRLSGAHPETVELLSQLAPVAGGRTYRLVYSYSTSGLPADTGLYWMADDAETGAHCMAARALLAAEDWKEGSTVFHTNPRTRLIRIVFGYRRAPGTTRAPGSVSLANVNVFPARDQPAAGDGVPGTKE
jgi:tetratricopeptide (TPR) repeat protein